VRSPWIVALLGLILAAPVLATPADNLHRLLAGIDTLEGSFDQLVLDSGGTRLQQSTGEMAMKRPGMFRWHTAEPFPQLLVADGKQLWLYDLDLEQVTQQSLDGRLEHTPALLLSGDLDQLAEAFTIAGPETGDSGIYRLQPKDANALFTVMRIVFEEGVPQEIQLEDNLGQRTSVAFSTLTLNPDLDDALFHFIPPAGVDLIIE